MGEPTKEPKPAPTPQNQAPPTELPTVPANRIIEGDSRGVPGVITGRN
jgi:hypothetical protein